MRRRRGATTVRDEARLDDQVAVVTGGGRGIGRAAAILLARAGAAVCVTARTAEEIERTAQLIRGEGGRALAMPADVSEWAAVERLAAAVGQDLGPVDILVANAGVIDPVGDTWEVRPEDWADNVGVNLTGVFYAIRAFLPTMVARRGGVVILVSSGAARHPVPGWSAYCAAKAGVDHLARTLAAEVDQRDLPIRVHAMVPGVVDTSMQERVRGVSRARFASVDRYRAYHERGVLRPPEEPGAVIWWLATPMASDLHGQVVNIDSAAVRSRVADDLGVPPFAARGA